MTFWHPNDTFLHPNVTSWYPKSLSGTRTSLQQPSMCTGRAPLAHTHEAAPTPGYNQPRPAASPHPWWPKPRAPAVSPCPGQGGLPAASPSLYRRGLVGDGAEPHTAPAPHSPSGRRAGGSGGAQRREELGLFIYRCVYLWKAFRRSHRRGGPGGSAAFRVSQPAKLSFPAGWEAQGCAPRPGPPCGPAAGNAAPSPAAWPGFKRSPASRLGEKVVFG